MHPSPRHPTRFFTPGQARALTLATALVLGLALGCTQAPDPGAATSSAAPPPRELPAPLASEDQGQIAQQDAYTFPPPPPPPVPEDRERYAKLTDNGVVLTQEQPVSTFSIDVDTGSYANVRRFLNQGQLPPKDAVRTEELLNYFDYAYPQPQKSGPAPGAAHRNRPHPLESRYPPAPGRPPGLSPGGAPGGQSGLSH
jgi:Ca-activated chloride channel family protein